MTQRDILKQEKCSSDDLQMLMNEIFSTDAELYMAILSILKQGKIPGTHFDGGVTGMFAIICILFLFRFERLYQSRLLDTKVLEAIQKKL
jgi:hypothetical protein